MLYSRNSDNSTGRPSTCPSSATTQVASSESPPTSKKSSSGSNSSWPRTRIQMSRDVRRTERAGRGRRSRQRQRSRQRRAARARRAPGCRPCRFAVRGSRSHREVARREPCTAGNRAASMIADLPLRDGTVGLEVSDQDRDPVGRSAAVRPRRRRPAGGSAARSRPRRARRGTRAPSADRRRGRGTHRSRRRCGAPGRRSGTSAPPVRRRRGRRRKRSAVRAGSAR